MKGHKVIPNGWRNLSPLMSNPAKGPPRKRNKKRTILQVNWDVVKTRLFKSKKITRMGMRKGDEYEKGRTK
jgi:hypothetical protein